MKIALVAAATALALSACSQGDADNVASNGLEADPATANLTMNSDASEVDQAINQTDRQSDLGNAAEEAANSVTNSVQ